MNRNKTTDKSTDKIENERELMIERERIFLQKLDGRNVTTVEARNITISIDRMFKLLSKKEQIQQIKNQSISI